MIISHLLSVCLVDCKRATGFSGLKSVGAPCDRSSCAHCPTVTEHSGPRTIVREGKVSNGYHRDSFPISHSSYPLPGCHARYRSENTRNFFKTQTPRPTQPMGVWIPTKGYIAHPECGKLWCSTDLGRTNIQCAVTESEQCFLTLTRRGYLLYRVTRKEGVVNSYAHWGAAPTVS